MSVKKKPVKRPKLFWHYTTQQGLAGILESKSLWASHAAFLNDTFELKHVLDVFEMLVSSTLGADRLAALSWDKIRQNLESSLVSAESFMDGTYVVSFSSKKDSLSQWRAYGGGLGLAIGFSRFPTAKTDPTWPMTLVPCLYKQSEKEEVLRSIVNLLPGSLPKKGDPARKSAMRSLVQQLLRALVRAAPSLKHHGFSDEREWRLVSEPAAVTRTTPCGFHHAKHFMVPHLTLSLASIADLGIGEIQIGPSPHPAQSIAAVKLLLKHHGITAEVSASNVPFRPG